MAVCKCVRVKRSHLTRVIPTLDQAMKKSRLYIEGEPLTVGNFAAKLTSFKSWETPLIKVATKAGGGRFARGLSDKDGILARTKL